MATLIEQAELKGWAINKGTLQAKGLWNAFRNEAKTDDDVTAWCTSATEAAREALRIEREQQVAQKKRNEPEFIACLSVSIDFPRVYKDVYETDDMPSFKRGLEKFLGFKMTMKRRKNKEGLYDYTFNRKY